MLSWLGLVISGRGLSFTAWLGHNQWHENLLLSTVLVPGGTRSALGLAGCCCLLNVPATCLCISGMDLLRQVYVLHATPRSKMQIKLSTLSSHSILTLGQLVPVLTLWYQAPGRVATGVPVLKSLVWLDLKKIPTEQTGVELRIVCSWGRCLDL